MKDIIQSLWIGDELSNIEKLCIKSYLFQGSQFHLYTYDQVKGVPDGTIIKDGNEILDQSLIFRDRSGSLGAFSDWFRFEMLYKKGGFYVDMDMICLKPFNFESDEMVFGKEDSKTVSGAIMKFPKGHSLCRHMADRCMKPNTILEYDTNRHKRKKLYRKIVNKNHLKYTDWGETAGPAGFSAYLKHKSMFDNAKPFYYFFPVHHKNWLALFDLTFKDSKNYFSDSYAVHLWNENLRNNGIDKNSVFEADSFFEKLLAQYNV